MTSRSRQHLSIILKLNTPGQKTPKPTGGLGGGGCLFGEFCACLGFFVAEILGFFFVFWFFVLFCLFGGFFGGLAFNFWEFF